MRLIEIKNSVYELLGVTTTAQVKAKYPEANLATLAIGCIGFKQSALFWAFSHVLGS